MMLNFFRRFIGSEKLDKENEELDDSHDILASKMAQLDAMQEKLAIMTATSRARQKESKEASEELKKTMSTRLTPEMLAKLRDTEEEENVSPYRHKLPSGAR